MLFEFLILFCAVVFWGSPVGISSFWGHIGAVIISLSAVGTLSRNCLLWLLLLITFFTAQEARFSIEYVLLAASFFCVGFGKKWQENKDDKRKQILFLIFVFLVIFNYLKIDFSERGSLLLWLPIFLVLYFKKFRFGNSMIYLASGISLYFSNKLTSLLAFLFSLRNKFLYFLSVGSVIAYFFFKQSFSSFLNKSIEPRIHIWKSVVAAFFDKPFFGHGFGTFALDFPLYRIHGKVLGGHVSEQISHGHSLFAHYAFELGIIGLLLILILFYLVYKNATQALSPLFIICLFDMPLATCSQFLLSGLILSPYIKDLGLVKKLIPNVHKKLTLMSYIFLLSLSFYVYVPSLIGHYFYDKGDLNQAIKWDKKNALYYFSRGAGNINTDSISSEKDFLKAIELSPAIPYFYGFLGAAQLANNKPEEAKSILAKAMKLDGEDGYWCLLYSYANYNEKEMYERYQKKAIRKNPEIKILLSKPHLTSAQYIGRGRTGDPRLAGFLRSGKEVYFPLPVID